MKKANWKPWSKQNLIGQRFGELEVIDIADKRPGDRAGRWLCRCSCGKTKEVSAHHLKSGWTQSCGHLSSVSALAAWRKRRSRARKRKGGKL